jgi:hypothetical protein
MSSTKLTIYELTTDPRAWELMDRSRDIMRAQNERKEMTEEDRRIIAEERAAIQEEEHGN